jgi:hypothetical protein
MAANHRDAAEATMKAEDGQPQGDETSNVHHQPQEQSPPKPGLLKKIWTKLDLDGPTILIMFKCASVRPYSLEPANFMTEEA